MGLMRFEVRRVDFIDHYESLDEVLVVPKGLISRGEKMTDNLKLEYVDTDFNKLSDEKIRIFKQFEILLNEKNNNKEVLYLYRGDMLNNMKKVFKESYSDNILENLFYFGVSSKFCFSESINEGKEKIFENINDYSDNVLARIFDDLNGVVQSTKFKYRYKVNNKKDKTYKPLDDNIENYFNNINNKSAFIEIFNNLATDKQKVLLRDYFLYLLHTSGKNLQDSILVSSSTKRSAAKDFTKREKKMKDNDRIIFHYFIVEPYSSHTITPWIMEELHQWIKSLELPIYRPTGLYPPQKEVSIKGALYPHRILGIEFIDKKKFVVNPNLFKFSVEDMQSLIECGYIPINQEEFLERMQEETNSDNSVWTYDDFCGLTKSIENK